MWGGEGILSKKFPILHLIGQNILHLIGQNILHLTGQNSLHLTCQKNLYLTCHNILKLKHQNILYFTCECPNICILDVTTYLYLERYFEKVKDPGKVGK